jgi:hypothetical protein
MKTTYKTRSAALVAKLMRLCKLRDELDGYKREALLAEREDALDALCAVRIEQIDNDVDRRSVWLKNSSS